MTKFSIEYNPYLVKCIFKKNDKELTEKSKIGARSKERLQILLRGSANWEGLMEEIERACDDNEVEIFFKGRKIDYDDLTYTAGMYKGNTLFTFRFEESKNDADIISALDKIFYEIKEKNLPEFHTENKEGKDVFDAYEEVKNGKFEESVIATMSSGKSTLINSMLHTELLPSENKPCTATIMRILDNDDMEHYEAECYASDEETVIYPKGKITPDMLREYNEDQKVTFIDIEGNIPTIPSDKIRLCLRDTPGPNNSRNENHERLTKSVIKRTNAVVLYVMNATQIGIKDDEQLLKDISNEMKRTGKQSRDRFIFVINKCDELDEEKGETVEKQLKGISEYLEKFGIVDPTLIPTSAKMALQIRKNRKGEELSKKEKKFLDQVGDVVGDELLHFEKYATLTPTVKEQLQKEVEKWHENKENWDLEALIHTGVPAVEQTICEYIDKYVYPMKIKDAIKDIGGILEELNMKSKFEESIARDEDTLETVRKQIKEAKERHQDCKKIYDDYKAIINDLRLEEADEKDKKSEVNGKLGKIVREYNGKTLVAKEEADRYIWDLQEKLESFQKDCEGELNRELDEKIFQRCNKMLEDYSEMINEILTGVEIEGYDFRKINSFQKIRIQNIDDIMKKNETTRYKEQTRWKDNPERKGFWGTFKIWRPRKISYTESVEDGINVNIGKVVIDIMGGFSKSIKRNIGDIFTQATEQIEEYKKIFTDNIITLYLETEKILDELERATIEKEVIENRVQKNRELASWMANKEEEIKALLTF